MECLAARGVTLVIAGGLTVKFGIGVPAALLGAKDFFGSYLKLKRGTQQCKEAISDPDWGHCKNLLGLAPFGAMIDDPGESPQKAWNDLKEKPWYEIIGEFISWL